ncbi:hypothetical protein GCK72_023300 [Caenorhabditis remanei]|uniref:Uncharacterized protein n=1 Tax=Caenorhabditis remanei TaxID=31234 RepID=A0A6A5FWF2_CAERE|nr:hypothetical protein GCK72_023300 [Caenorhabditis remanei]KAF1746842.1 hypothetical protein GCK72_023300 [Caenorhabditis remanei]
MSSRPATNLEKLLASIKLHEDDAVMTPEPLIATGHTSAFNFNQIPPPCQDNADSQDEEKSEDEFFTASQGTTNSSSSEDVPLTVELLTSGTQVHTAIGTRIVWNVDMESRQKRLTKRLPRSRYSRVPIKKNEILGDLSASSDLVFQYDSTSDGLDAYQERERNKKRKMRKRQDAVDEKRGIEKEKKN